MRQLGVTHVCVKLNSDKQVCLKHFQLQPLVNKKAKGKKIVDAFHKEATFRVSNVNAHNLRHHASLSSGQKTAQKKRNAAVAFNAAHKHAQGSDNAKAPKLRDGAAGALEPPMACLLPV